jgi:DMSO/TMAO reductase YedYZ molybdopterin-dependent catalytic subunit
VLIGGASVLAAFGSLTAQALNNVKPVRAPEGGPTPADPFGPTPALTPVGDFYQVSKNLTPTTVDGASWKLTVDGLVDRPYALTLDELMAIPSVSGHRTMECISTNIVRGDHLIGNQEWRGVPISTLLDRAGVQASAGWILWEADDGFTESAPLEVAREADSWIVYEMGGALLTAEHGFPARVLIAGRFGMKQPKWLRRMQVADHDEDGFWVVRGWDKEAIVKPMSRIDYPKPLAELPVGEPFWVTGIANAGDRGIMRVELSLDDGTTWADAELDDAATAPLGPLTWVRWRTQATLDRAGQHRLRVRATDGSGQVQDGVETEPIPSGATGWHRITLRAVPPSS